MDECGSCGRTLATRWKFCIYCGAPMATTLVSAAAVVAAPTAAAAVEVGAEVGTPSRPEYVFDDSEEDELSRRGRKHDAPFWVGVSMGVAGLGIIIFAATEMLASHG